MKDSRRFIKMHNRFIEEYDSREHLTYLIIQGMNNHSYRDLSILSVESIISILGVKMHSDAKKNICESIQILIDNNIVEVYNSFQCNERVDTIDKNKTYFFKSTGEYNAEYFAKIYTDDIDKILCMNEAKNRAKILSVYLNIVSRIFDSESSDKYTLPTIEEIENETGINRKSVSKYIKLLVESELIYCATERLDRDKTKNYYSRWEHRGILKSKLGN